MTRESGGGGKTGAARKREGAQTAGPRHPDDDVLESYCLGSLKGKKLGEVENHLILCEACRNRARSSQRFIRAMRIAATELAAVPLNFTHATEDGPVHLYVRPADGGGWVASVERITPFDTVEEANRFLLRAFGRMYPEHTCAQCTAGRPRTRGR